MHRPEDLAAMNAQALRELAGVVERIETAQVQALIDALAGAGRIALHGLGREGLMMRAFAMRLFHLGLDAHVVGDVTLPPLGAGDLLLVSAGPGHLRTVEALCEVARQAGARIACLTAVAQGSVPRAADLVLVLPAQTMASDATSPTSILPMGSLYEGAQFLVFEHLVALLQQRLGVSAEQMRGNHTNLE